MGRTAPVNGLIWVIAFMLFAAACDRPDERMYPIGPGVKASFVIYFNTGVTQEQINNFSEHVLSRPRADGRGADHREGVRTFLRLSSVQGHEAIAITFFPSATTEQRSTLIQDVKASSVVYKVLEDVVPADIKKL
jgi:hypothetical protein